MPILLFFHQFVVNSFFWQEGALALEACLRSISHTTKAAAQCNATGAETWRLGVRKPRLWLYDAQLGVGLPLDWCTPLFLLLRDASEKNGLPGFHNWHMSQPEAQSSAPSIRSLERILFQAHGHSWTLTQYWINSTSWNIKGWLSLYCLMDVIISDEFFYAGRLTSSN